jgi:hypothetical protein
MQSMPDVRVLIIDNASTDDSVEIAQRLVKSDRRVELIAHSHNIGHVGSINEGIDWAQSEYFLMLCSDDILASGALARAVTLLDLNSEIVACLGDYVSFTDDEAVDFLHDGADGRPSKVFSGHQYIRARCRWPMIAKGNFFVVRTDVQKKAGHYRSALSHTCDFEMILRLCRFGLFAEVPTIQGYRREHSGGIANACRDRLARLRACQEAIDSFFAHEGQVLADASSLRADARESLAGQAFWSGVANLISGRPRAAGEMFRFAVSQSPRCAFMPPIAPLMSKKLFSRVTLAMSEAIAGRSVKVGSD